MATPNKDDLKLLRQQTVELANQKKTLTEQLAVYKQISAAQKNGENVNQKVLKALQDQFSTVEDLQKKLEEIAKDLKDKQQKYIEKYNKDLEEQLKNFEDIEDTVKSINTNQKAGLKNQKEAEKLLSKSKAIISSIPNILIKGKGVSEQQKEQVLATVTAYKNFQSVANSAFNDLQKGNITQEQYASAVEKAYDNFKLLSGGINIAGKKGDKLKKKLDQLSKLALPKVIESQIKDFQVLENSIKKVGTSLGTNSNLYKQLQKDAASLQGPYSEISNILTQQIGLESSKRDLNDKQLELVKQTTASYTQYKSIVAQSALELEKGSITQQEYANRIRAAYDNFTELSNEIDTTTSAGQKLIAEIDKLKKNQEGSIFAASLADVEDLEKISSMITNRLGENDGLAQAFQKKTAVTKILLEDMAHNIAAIAGSNQKVKQQALEATKSYQQMHSSIAKAQFELAKGQITAEEYNQIIKRAADEFQDVAASIDTSTAAGKKLKAEMQGMVNEAKAFEEASKKSTIQIQMMDQAFDSFSGIPAMRELNTLLKTNKADTVALTLAFAALGAAIASAAFDYFGAGVKEGMKATYEAQKREIQGAKQVQKIRTDATFNQQKIQNEVNRNQVETANNVAKAINDAAFAGAKAANQFNAAMKSAAAEFKAASKTALFGNKLGGVGYATSQLQMAGIGAEAIANQMQAAANATGQMPTAEVGADMAVIAKRTGQSAENIGQLNEYFQRTEGVSAKTALNMQEGMRAMADKAGLNLSNFMKEVAEASKDALSYNIKSGPALAKQVAYAQSLGVSFGDIAKAGKNMVLNYKDSIKAEMQLSSLLGEQVDLSEVRQKFAEGDTEGALKALKSQGLDPADMDMFQQQALSEALGGMDVSSISKIATKEGKDAGNLKAGNAKGGNEKFLKDTQEAQRELTSEQASISAQQAIVDAKLSGQITDAYLNSPAYKKYLDEQAKLAENEAKLATEMDAFSIRDPEQIKLNTQEAKLSIEQGIKEGLLGGTVKLFGAAAGALLGPLGSGIGKIFKGGPVGKFLGKITGKGKEQGGGGGGGVADSVKGAAVSAVSGKADELIPGAGGVVEGLSEKIDAVEAPLQKAMTFGEKLKDFGQGLGSFLASVGKGIGDAIGGILKGVASGLGALGKPNVLLGIVSLAGLAGSLWLAGKGLQQFQGLDWSTIGMAFVTMLGLGAVGAVLGFAAPFIIAGSVALLAISAAFAVFGLAAAIAIPNLIKLGEVGKAAGGIAALGLALPVLSVGLLALGAAELINGVMGFVGKIFGGGKSIFDRLIELASFGPGLRQAADAVRVLAPAFSTLGKVDDGDNLVDLTDNLKSAMDKMDEGTMAKMKAIGPSMYQIGYGANALGAVKANANIPILGQQILQLLDPKIMGAITQNLPVLNSLGTGLISFTASTTGLGQSLAAVVPMLTALMANLQMFGAVATSLDVTTAAMLRMAEALREVAGINTSNLSKIPWAQMTNFSQSPGGNFVLAKSANNNFTIEKNTAANIADIDVQAKVNNNINKNLQNILMALLDIQTGKEGTIKLMIDGKPVSKMIQSRADDRKGGNADKK